MLTKERTSKTRKFKYAAVALALLAVLVFCFASCGKATPTGIEYVAGTAAKVEYNQGETFDCTGAQIKVTYDNGAVETVDVTAEMVGNAPLALGVETISVTYSENGATVVGYIPVSVKDPYAAQKSQAIDGFYANDKVVANKSDKGVDLLIRDYTVKINEATSADAIETVKTNFATALDTYLGKKADIIAKFENDADLVAKMAKLYDQFATGIATEKGTAIANINAASSIEEAEAYFNAFVAAVDNAIAEQKVYEGDGTGANGQINDKIGLLELIEKYQERSALLMQIVEDALAAGEINTDAYDAAMDLATGYPFANKRLSWWEKYITLAIDLGGVQKALEDEIGNLLKTPVDDAAALLQAGTTIYPTAYKLDGDAYVDDTDSDAIAKLIDAIENPTTGYYALAEDKFGATGLATLKAEYGVKGGQNLIDVVLEKIKTRYNELNAIRDAGKSVVTLIDTAFATADGDAKATAVNNAWQALKDWGAANAIFSFATVDAENNPLPINTNNLVFDKEFANVVYAAKLYEGVWTTADETWTAYAIKGETEDSGYVVKYFIPNLAKLIEATQAQDAFEAKQLVDAIPEIGDIVFSYTAADSNATIVAAEDALAAFKKDYGDEIYNKYFVVEGVDETKKTVDDARAQYGKLVEMAIKANAAIDAYETIVGATATDNGAAKVARSHYESAEAPLKAAYVLYCEFAKENTTTAGDVYTDVIEQSDASTLTNNETNLVAYMDAYVDKAYVEERKVQSTAIISKAYLDRLALINTDETDFRALLTEYKSFAIDYVCTQPEFEYKTTITVGTETLVKSNFNYDELLAANLKVATAFSSQIADSIEKLTFANGNLMYDFDADGTPDAIYPVAP